MQQIDSDSATERIKTESCGLSRRIVSKPATAQNDPRTSPGEIPQSKKESEARIVPSRGGDVQLISAVRARYHAVVKRGLFNLLAAALCGVAS
jgi:hypothetical protein